MDQVGNGGSGTRVGLLARLPGRHLQAVIAEIDVHDLSGCELSLMLAAQARLLAWVQAGMALTTNEFVHCPASAQLPTGRAPEVQQFASDEVALLLHVAPMTATNVVLSAVDLVERHPRLWAALSDGLIDVRKVAVVTSTCPDTDDALAAAVDDVLLSTAARADGSTASEQTIAETPGALRCVPNGSSRHWIRPGHGQPAAKPSAVAAWSRPPMVQASVSATSAFTTSRSRRWPRRMSM